MLAVFSLQPSYFLLPFLWDYRYSSTSSDVLLVCSYRDSLRVRCNLLMFLSGLLQCIPELGDCKEIIYRS